MKWWNMINELTIDELNALVKKSTSIQSEIRRMCGGKYDWCSIHIAYDSDVKVEFIIPEHKLTNRIIYDQGYIKVGDRWLRKWLRKNRDQFIGAILDLLGRDNEE